MSGTTRKASQLGYVDAASGDKIMLPHWSVFDGYQRFMHLIDAGSFGNIPVSQFFVRLFFADGSFDDTSVSFDLSPSTRFLLAAETNAGAILVIP